MVAMLPIRKNRLPFTSADDFAEKTGDELLKSGSKIRCENKKASVEAVCIDRNGAYRAVIKEQLPDAAVVYDRFHLIQNINKAIDEVRRDAYREADAEGKNVIKGQRFNLYRNPENLSDTGEVALSYLLDINKKLNIAYVLKDQFRLVWTYSKAGWARRFLQSWVWWAKASGVQPMVRFAKGIQRDLEDIISWCRHRISNGKIEGFNSTISRIIHKSRGIRSLDYLFLKLRQETALHF
jgi:transposase